MELRHLDINNQKYFYVFDRGEKVYVGKTKPTSLKNIKKPRSKLNAVELLQDVQDKNNFISEEDLIQISQNFDIPLIKLSGIATFYTSLKTTKEGKNHIKLCNGTACNIKHSPQLLNYIKELLKIKPGETTEDNLFSLEVVNCIGACARAPAMMINDKIYGELSKEKIERLIEELK